MKMEAVEIQYKYMYQTLLHRKLIEYNIEEDEIYILDVEDDDI